MTSFPVEMTIEGYALVNFELLAQIVSEIYFFKKHFLTVEVDIDDRIK